MPVRNLVAGTRIAGCLGGDEFAEEIVNGERVVVERLDERNPGAGAGHVGARLGEAGRDQGGNGRRRHQGGGADERAQRLVERLPDLIAQ